MFNIQRFTGAEDPTDATPQKKRLANVLDKAKLRAKRKALKLPEAQVESGSKPLNSTEAPSIAQSLAQLQNADTRKKELKAKRRRKEKLGDVQGRVKKVSALKDDMELWQLSPLLCSNLENLLKIHHLFGIQRNVLNTLYGSSTERNRVRDFCVFAPTGSGKTLAFAVPVVQQLMNRQVARLRALILLPTRELAAQVFNVFELCCKGMEIKVACVTGHVPVHVDKEVLQGQPVDILVATPGRLMDHLNNGHYLSLQHVEFLIIDEADKLLSQSYHGWLKQVYDALYAGNEAKNQEVIRKVGGKLVSRIEINASTTRSQHGGTLHSFQPDEPPLRKILCSATLARDPQTLAALRLNRPLYISQVSSNVHDSLLKEENGDNDDRFLQFFLPSSLECKMQLCTRANKPLALIQLLHNLEKHNQRSLVFTRSLKATHRLYLLLKFMDEFKVAELSGSSTSKDNRGKIVKQFAEGKIKVLICSDVIARGIDIPGLETVINYDVPLYVKTLVHRAGRTARAGKQGTCYALVPSEQARHYRQLLAQLNTKPKLTKVVNEELSEYKPQYKSALQQMKTAIKAESNY